MRKLLNLIGAMVFIAAVKVMTPAEVEFPETYEVFTVDGSNWLDHCLNPNKPYSSIHWCIIELEDATRREYRWGKGPLMLFRTTK